MNRTQSKFLLISAAMHALLVLMLVVGSAFSPERPVTDDMPIIHFIPDITTDEKAFNPGEQGPPPAPGPKTQTFQSLPVAPPETKKVEIAPVRPEPKPEPETKPEPKVDPKPETKPEPEPEKEDIKKQANPDDLAVDPPKKQVKPPKKERVIELKPVTRNSDTKAAEAARKRDKEAADRRAKAEAAEAWNKQLSQSIGNIKGGLSSGISMEGVVGGKGSGGTGGPAYANWAQTVISLYDNCFVAPDNVNDSSVSTRVKIVVSRDGRVISDTIVKRSGNAALDRAVSATLERIRSVPRFPEGASDERRTLYLNFNIHGKLSAG